MIGRDSPMALVVMKDGVVKKTINLGYSTLDGNEYYKVCQMAERYGCHVEIQEADLSEVSGFAELFREVEESIK